MPERSGSDIEVAIGSSSDPPAARKQSSKKAKAVKRPPPKTAGRGSAEAAAKTLPKDPTLAERRTDMPAAKNEPLSSSQVRQSSKSKQQGTPGWIEAGAPQPNGPDDRFALLSRRGRVYIGLGLALIGIGVFGGLLTLFERLS